MLPSPMRVVKLGERFMPLKYSCEETDDIEPTFPSRPAIRVDGNATDIL